MAIDRARATQALKAFEFRKLFVEELGWENPASRHEERVSVNGADYVLAPVADKRGVRIFHCPTIPEDRTVRQKVEREVAKLAYEHLIIFTDATQTQQVWQWVAREKGRPAAFREHRWIATQSADPLIQKIDHITFSLDDEEGLTLTGVTVRLADAFDREKITKRFYEDFKQQHDNFLGFIKGLTSAADKAWYASLMLNRLMFVYFIQKKRFLDGDIDYLKNRLSKVRAEQGKDQFHSFYRAFLLKLFHGGLATPASARDAETAKLIGNIPYLNGGLFEPHALESEGHEIQIADKAFESIFAFFDGYEWTLDTRAIERADGKEINPDVLGHIFEKYINQKQMGAYYTKEDVTDYITRSTVIPWLFHNAEGHDKVAFEPGGAVWRMLSENPNTYIFRSVRHGADQPLPKDIAAGLGDVSKRTDWNTMASPEIGLPTETWREVIARRKRYDSVKSKASAGKISSIEEFIAENLDIRQFALDAIQYAESPDLVRAFWKGISVVKVLDPACGSGAFLFAALNILYDLYDACLERMEQFVASAPDGSGPRQLYSDFREVLARIARHPSRPYFIYKSIILDNLYGVDIMDEAVEICKLRLFLKLAAQLETAEQIEPLPDIDFNIRPGNTLIGYTSFDDVRRAQDRRGFALDDQAAAIEASAHDLDAAFRLYREQQTELHGTIDGAHKADLRARLAALGAQLDRFLARDYGVESSNLADEAKLNVWKASRKPFHWLVEFYGIIHAGGFDVVVGNPPYVEYSKVRDEYQVIGYDTLTCGNLYAYFIERSFALGGKNCRYGQIIPTSSISTDRMLPLSGLFTEKVRYISTYGFRPGKLFEGSKSASIHVSIVLYHLLGDRNELWATGHIKWPTAFREYLMEVNPSYGRSMVMFGRQARIGCNLHKSVMDKIIQHKSLGESLSVTSRHPVYYRSTGGLHYRVFSLFETGSKKETSIFFGSKEDSEIGFAALASNLWNLWYYSVSNCLDVSTVDIKNFPLGLARMPDGLRSRLAQKARELNADIESKSFMAERVYAKAGAVQTLQINMRQSKELIDDVDRLLAEHYKFSEAELDFVINNDIRYRLADEDDDD